MILFFKIIAPICLIIATILFWKFEHKILHSKEQHFTIFLFIVLECCIILLWMCYIAWLFP